MIFGLMMAVAGSAAGGTLARPSAPAFSAAPGDEDGEVEITVSALPVSWGDLTVPGDGDGAAGLLQWGTASDGWQTLSDPAATGADTVTVDSLLWGITATISVRGVSAAGAQGVAASVTVAVPPIETPDGIGPVWPDDTVWPDDDTIWPAEE